MQYLELGYYGEALGRKIGEVIKPSKSNLVENEAKKKEYLERKEQLDKVMLENNIKKQNLDREIAEGKISMVSARKKISEIKANIEAYKKEEENLISSIEKLREKDNNEKLKEHYSDVMEDIINKQLINTNKLVKEIMEEVSEREITKSREMFDKKVDFLKESLSTAISNKGIIEEEVNSKRILLSELSSYENWINEWVN